MARLPTLGGDNDIWGDVLNDYLLQAHNSNGSIKNSAIGGLQGRAVSSTAPTNGQTLTYNAGSSQWEPQTAAAGYTDGDAQDAVGTILTDTSTVNFTYNSGVPSITADVIASGIDHGGLSGLGDDDHAQYALLLGRAGGQTLYGGTAAADHLTLGANDEAWSSLSTGRVRISSPISLTGMTSVAVGGVDLRLIRFNDTVTIGGTINTWSVTGFLFEPVINYSAAAVLTVAPAFQASSTFKITTPGLADAFMYFSGFTSAVKHQLDHSGSGGSTGFIVGYLDQPALSRAAGTGTHTVTEFTSFSAFEPGVTHVGTGYTATTSRSFHAKNLAVTGTLTNSIGLDVDSLTTGSTADIGVRIAHPALANGISASTDNIALAIPAATTALSNTSATLTNKHGISIGIATMTSGAATRTVTNSASLYIAGATVAGSNVSVTNGPYSLWVDAGTARFDGRILGNQGADVASANSLTLGSDGNVFEITGTTQINTITTTNWQNGSKISLLFTSTPTVSHNNGGAGSILLAGAANFVASAGDTLTLVLSEIGGTQAWREIGRAVI